MSSSYHHGFDSINNHTEKQLPNMQAKKQSVGVISAATAAAAKSWGWNVLSRVKEQKQPYHGDGAGTPESPLGRGRPLPPPGQPLPLPEKPSTKVAHHGPAKRKPVPSNLPPSRRLSEASVRSEKVPSRRRQPSIADEQDAQDSLLVVGIPSVSKPPSPQADDVKLFPNTPVEASMEGPSKDFLAGSSATEPHNDNVSVGHNKRSVTSVVDHDSREVLPISETTPEELQKHDDV